MDLTFLTAIIGPTLPLVDTVSDEFIEVNVTPLEGLHGAIWDLRIETAFTQGGKEIVSLISNLMPTAVEMLGVLSTASRAMLMAGAY